MSEQPSGTVKKCRYCGKEIASETPFCWYCGRELETRPEHPMEPEKNAISLRTFIILGAILMVIVLAVLLSNLF